MAKFQLSKSDLLSRLQVVNKIILSRPTLPILSNILFEVEGNKLHLSASDLSGQIKTTIDNVQSDASILFSLESKLLIEAIKTLPEQPLIFEVNEQNSNTVIKYHGGKFEMVAQAADDSLKIKDVADPVEVEIPLDIFLNGITKTIGCSADDELRPIMNSVFIDAGKGFINHVASDGKTLALIEHKDDSLTETISFALPKKIASILRSILPSSDTKNIKIFIGTNRVRFEHESYCIVAQLIEGRFPNYRSVIPSNNDKSVNVSTATLKSALNRVLVFSSQTSRLVTFNLSFDSLVVAGQDIDYSTCADEEIQCEYSGAPFKIGFNGTMLSDLLSSISCSDITITFSEPTKSALIYPTDNNDTDRMTCLIMPLAIN